MLSLPSLGSAIALLVGLVLAMMSSPPARAQQPEPPVPPAADVLVEQIAGAWKTVAVLVERLRKVEAERDALRRRVNELVERKGTD